MVYADVSVRYLFYQPVVIITKTWTRSFSAKENEKLEKRIVRMSNESAVQFVFPRI